VRFFLFFLVGLEDGFLAHFLAHPHHVGAGWPLLGCHVHQRGLTAVFFVLVAPAARFHMQQRPSWLMPVINVGVRMVNCLLLYLID